MTFDDVLEQVIMLLKRQGRVSYPALKIRFSLDDEYLEALKAELLYVHPVRDDDGRGLIWTGDTASGQAVTSRPAQTTQQPAVQELPSSEVAPLSPAPPPDAERRQLTVMFCDLVDSTKLSSQLDPEEYRDVVRAYQTACTEVIRHYDGHIAQLLGDGLLIYFGYPQAHEDDAQRAVRTGLGILDAMRDLPARLKQEKGIPLAVRVGIHTGLVVIGEMGDHGRQEQLALGETPNIAARIEGLAQPNTLVISEATSRLVEGYFTSESLGEHTLRGVSQPLNIQRVLGVSDIHSRLEVAQTRGLTPLVGREQEVGLLLERWEQAKAGHGQVVLLSGEAGIGKSRLVQTLKDHIANEPHVRWECRSVEHYQNTALFPLVDLFQRIFQLEMGDTPDEKFGKLEQMLSQYRLPLEETVPVFAPLLSLSLPESRYAPLNVSPQRQRQKTLETLVAILQEDAERHPVLFIVEDLHWTDPTTLELLHLVIEQIPTTSIFTVLTCRSHFQPAWHHRSYLSEITVNRLSHAHVEQIITRMTDGKTFPPEVLQQIIAKTDGVPLFVEELTKAILESGQLKALNGHYELAGSLRSLTIPATLQDSLMARLDRLVSAKGIAQLGAVVGRQFSFALLKAVAQLDEATLQCELGRLVEAELVYQKGVPPQAMYTFKHALVQETAYESLLRSTRQGYHRRIAAVLEGHMPETVETPPELLAHHYTEGGMHAQAVEYWYKAGQQARERSAHREAISHLQKGLEVLALLPETSERAQHELPFHLTLHTSLCAIHGYASPEVSHCIRRARALCQYGGDAEQLYTMMEGMRAFHLVRADLQTARELAEHILSLVQRDPQPARLVVEHRMLGNILVHLGEFPLARDHIEQAVTIAASESLQSSMSFSPGGQEPKTSSLTWLGHALWMLGYPDQARQRSDEGVALAQQLAQPLNLAVALNQWLRLQYVCGTLHLPIAQERAVTAMRLATEHGFAQQLANETFRQGLLLAQHGQVQEGIIQMQQGWAAYRATGANVRQPMYLAPLAKAYGQAGQVAEGLQLLAEALAYIEQSGERWWEADIHRLKGELLLQQNAANQVEAENCFQQAITVAQNQQAKSWELRAATSLARLWQQQGKRGEARQVLAEVYDWFTEGFDTPDLQDAKALLDELA